MTGDGYYILAADEGFWRLVPLIALLVLGAIAKLLSKAKEKYKQEQAKRMEQESEQEQRARQGRPAQQPPAKPQAPARREPTSAQQVMTVLRQALTGEQPAAPTRQPPPPPAQQPQQRARRRPKPAQAAAQAPAERRLSARQPGRQARKLGRLDVAEAQSPEAPTAQALALQLNLGDRNEAARGIVLAEVLGLPKALRRGPEIWDA